MWLNLESTRWQELVLLVEINGQEVLLYFHFLFCFIHFCRDGTGVGAAMRDFIVCSFGEEVLPPSIKHFWSMPQQHTRLTHPHTDTGVGEQSCAHINNSCVNYGLADRPGGCL